MRFHFLISALILGSFIGSLAANAKVENMNTLIQQASTQEKRLHRKLLKAIQGSQTAIAHHDKRQIKSNDENLELAIQLR